MTPERLLPGSGTIVNAQGSLGIQSWWTWVLGAGLWIAIYAITGQNII